MKENVLKPSLPNFAFALAIVASFAFSAMPHVNEQYYLESGTCKAIPIDSRVNSTLCKAINGGVICTTTIDGLSGYEVFENQFPSTTCSYTLRSDIEQ